jgi:hypothetical protein
MVISCDSSPPLVRLRVVRRSLRKLHPVLNTPVFPAWDVVMVINTLVLYSGNSSSYILMKRMTPLVVVFDYTGLKEQYSALCAPA